MRDWSLDSLDQGDAAIQPVGGAARAAMCHALSTRVSSAQAPMAHPTTRRDKRSRTTARESHPSDVPIAVLSPLHTRIGTSGWELASETGGGHPC